MVDETENRKTEDRADSALGPLRPDLIWEAGVGSDGGGG